MLNRISSIPVELRCIVSLVIGMHAFMLLGALYGQSTLYASPSADTLIFTAVSNTSIPISLNSAQKSHATQTAKAAVQKKPSATRVDGSDGMELSSPRVAPNVSERNIYPNPKPPYPLSSRRLREQGAVKLSLCINRLGTVESVSMINSSGYEKLDRSAIETVRTWKFASLSIEEPASIHCYSLPIQFSLEA